MPGMPPNIENYSDMNIRRNLGNTKKEGIFHVSGARAVDFSEVRCAQKTAIRTDVSCGPPNFTVVNTFKVHKLLPYQ